MVTSAWGILRRKICQQSKSLDASEAGVLFFFLSCVLYFSVLDSVCVCVRACVADDALYPKMSSSTPMLHPCSATLKNWGKTCLLFKKPHSTFTVVFFQCFFFCLEPLFYPRLIAFYLSKATPVSARMIGPFVSRILLLCIYMRLSLDCLSGVCF